MGFVKHQLIELEQRERSGRNGMDEDKVICIDCILNEGIQDFIRKKERKSNCTYCNTHNYSLNLGKVIDHIHKCLLREYETVDFAIEDYGTYDSEERAYINIDLENLMYASDILEIVGLKCRDDDIFEAIKNGLGDEWCEKSSAPSGPINENDLGDEWREKSSFPSGLTNSFTWEGFKKFVMRESRFFFENYLAVGTHGGDTDKPLSIIRLINKYIDEFNLVRQVKKGDILYRSRIFSDNTAKENLREEQLRLPQNDGTVPSSRMSPDGIPVFYLSSDADTAVKEIHYDQKKYLVLSKWKVIKDFNIVDMTKVFSLDAGDFFHEEYGEYEYNKIVIFLKSFSEDISQPIKKDKKVHIEYVPTQIISEHIKLRREEKGVCYKSSQSTNEGKNFALFMDTVDYKTYLKFLEGKYIG